MNTFLSGGGGLGRGRLWRSQAWTTQGSQWSTSPATQTKPWLQAAPSTLDIPYIQIRQIELESPDLDSADFSFSPRANEPSPPAPAVVDPVRSEFLLEKPQQSSPRRLNSDTFAEEISQSIADLDRILDLFDDEAEAENEEQLYNRTKYSTPTVTDDNQLLTSVVLRTCAKTAVRNVEIRKTQVIEEEIGNNPYDITPASTIENVYSRRKLRAGSSFESSDVILTAGTVNSRDSAVFFQSNENEDENDYETFLPVPSADEKSNPDSGYLPTDQESIGSGCSGSVRSSQPASLRSYGSGRPGGRETSFVGARFSGISAASSDEDAGLQRSDLSTASTLTHYRDEDEEEGLYEKTFPIPAADPAPLAVDESVNRSSEVTEDIYDEIKTLPRAAAGTLHRQGSLSTEWSRNLPEPLTIPSRLSGGSASSQNDDPAGSGGQQVPPHPGFAVPSSPFKTPTTGPRLFKQVKPPPPPKTWRSADGSVSSRHGAGSLQGSVRVLPSFVPDKVRSNPAAGGTFISRSSTSLESGSTYGNQAEFDARTDDTELDYKSLVVPPPPPFVSVLTGSASSPSLCPPRAADSLSETSLTSHPLPPVSPDVEDDDVAPFCPPNKPLPEIPVVTRAHPDVPRTNGSLSKVHLKLLPEIPAYVDEADHCPDPTDIDCYDNLIQNPADPVDDGMAYGNLLQEQDTTGRTTGVLTLTPPAPPPPPPPPPSFLSGDSTDPGESGDGDGVAPPPPPPPAPPLLLSLPTQNNSPSSGTAGCLAAALMAVKLKAVIESGKQSPKVPLHNDALSAVVTQIQEGVQLRSTPLGSRIRDRNSDEIMLPNEEPEASTARRFTVATCPTEVCTTEQVTVKPTTFQNHSLTRNANISETGMKTSLPRPPPKPKVKPGVVEKTLPTPVPEKPVHRDCPVPSIVQKPTSHNSCSTLDVTQLPGYHPVPADCPPWKRAMQEKKNAQIISEALKQLEEKKKEEERWKDVPEWKRHLILRKQDDKTSSTTAAETTPQQLKRPPPPPAKKPIMAT